jgi:hypothetical protein
MQQKLRTQILSGVKGPIIAILLLSHTLLPQTNCPTLARKSPSVVHCCSLSLCNSTWVVVGVLILGIWCAMVGPGVCNNDDMLPIPPWLSRSSIPHCVHDLFWPILPKCRGMNCGDIVIIGLFCPMIACNHGVKGKPC